MKNKNIEKPEEKFGLYVESKVKLSALEVEWALREYIKNRYNKTVKGRADFEIYADRDEIESLHSVQFYVEEQIIDERKVPNLEGI